MSPEGTLRERGLGSPTVEENVAAVLESFGREGALVSVTGH